MKLAAIVTIATPYLLSNYGTFFQHYALRRVLKKMGYFSVRVSDPAEPRSRVGWKWRVVRRFCGNVLRVLCGGKKLRIDVPNKLFEKDYLTLIGEIYEKYPSAVDMAVVGSDQIWQSISPYAWLEQFQHERRISYAASSDWRRCSADRRWVEGVQRLYHNMDAVSVREVTGVETFATLGLDKPKAVCVCDPTTLLEKSDYHEIADDRLLFEKPTLFCYFVNERVPVVKLRAIADRFKVQLRILGIQGAEYLIPSDCRVRLTPRQFLAAMRDAKYVITNSYHGMLFAVYFEKKFLFVLQSSPCGLSQNIRQLEVLDRYGLESRGANIDMDYDVWAGILGMDVDWRDVASRVQMFRQFSYEWLKDNIKGGEL